MNDDLILVVGKLADTVKNGGATVLNQAESKAMLDRLLESVESHPARGGEAEDGSPLWAWDGTQFFITK